MKLELPEIDKAFLAAAHETQHIVQINRGEKPMAYLDPGYDNSRYELDAWKTAFSVYKDKNPSTRGTVRFGNQSFDY